MSDPAPRRPIRAFLSHRYGAPAVNLRFFALFDPVADVLFSVDIGELDTNVTRLERLVRDADAFIGLYPLAGDPQQPVSQDELRQQSRYFRLELDLAVRAGLPAIVFADSRYGNVLACPASVQRHAFDAQDVAGPADSPSMQVCARAFEAFLPAALAYQDWRVRQAVGQRQRGSVALLLPPGAYPPDVRRVVRDAIEATGRDVLEPDWPPRLSGRFHAQLSAVDWAVVDVGDDAEAAGITAYLHGAFVPAIRLRRAQAAAGGPLQQALYGAIEVGYAKDIVVWQSADELAAALAARLNTLLLPQRLIGTAPEARAYFESAALRKELVFVSYAGADAALAQPVIAALKRSFKTVFDYKDGASIEPGRPWLDEIFNKLSRSAAGVMLLSPAYLASGNCVHEAREMMARHDDGQLQLLPLRLTNEKLDAPTWLGAIQHARLATMQDPAEVPALVARLLAKPPAA